MSLRTRFALAFALVGAVVAVLVGVLSYAAAADRTTAETDRTLRGLTTAVAATLDSPTPGLGTVVPDVADVPGPGPRGPDGRTRPEQQPVARTVAPDGTVTPLGGPAVALPVTAAVRALAAEGAAGRAVTTEVVVGRDRFRVLTTALGDGRGALQVAVDVERTARVLGGLAVRIALVSAAVLLAAAAAGALLAHRITRRLVLLAGVAEEVSADGGIDREIPVGGRDEVGRLAASLTRMLARLAAAREAQDRLVQDAAHELRTPLTSLRTNAAVLRRADELTPDARARLVDDLQGETRELSRLVDELVELALSGGADPAEPEEPVELDAVARRAAERLTRRTGRAVRVHAGGGVVLARRRGLDRAVGNLLENAAKFDGAGEIELTVDGATVTVADRGPGIAAADAGRVFDRFFRADTARGLPGSGLGLAIVRDVAQTHGGTVFARPRPGGGAAVGFSLGAARLLPDSDPGHAAVSPGSTTVEGTRPAPGPARDPTTSEGPP